MALAYKLLPWLEKIYEFVNRRTKAGIEREI